MNTDFNKICLFAGNYAPLGWAYCNGQNGTPLIPDLVINSKGHKMRYICCTSNEETNYPFTGLVFAFAGSLIPNNCHKCDGTLLDTNSNSALNAIIGNQYGGNGSSTFALPNMTDLKDSNKNAPVTYLICLNGLFPSRF